MNDWEKIEGSPFPLGATWIDEESAFNFSLYFETAHPIRRILYATDFSPAPGAAFEHAERLAA